ncbi:glycosyltransferase N-terminal domain-containing protein [Thioclava litoralis]|uniref:3-deoxy-D-manno-octulosonic acid transferase n=1 Tax=Thioclava litoralis TaxID=3076557 RepID=A0ABZ1E368_9RHOB|nr:glycosyltransferase N-terminal domain-containing protein [Thioclava sp. FTW29]
MPVPLWLHLKLSGLNRPSALPERLTPVAGRTKPPIWVRLSGVSSLPHIEAVLQMLIGRLADRPFIVTGPATLLDRVALPRECHPFPDPPDTNADIHAALTVWAPDLVLLIGQDLPPALISGAHSHAIPIILVGGHHPRTAYAARLLRMVHTILTETTEENLHLIGLGAHPNRLIACGPLSLPPPPLSCSGKELVAMGDLLQNRPTWFATSVPEDEMDMVLEAHMQALRHAHRLLLFLAPDSSGDAVELAQRLTDEGWHVARRSLEGEPDPHTQVFIADDPDDYGLWYRLAPLSYIGGTFSGQSRAPRSPMEAAALGSAVLHGPDTGAFEAAYHELQAGQASKRLTSKDDLSEAVIDLLAPHRAAFLARNAWDVETAGAGAIEALIDAIHQALPAAP